MSEVKEFEGEDFTELATRWGINLDESNTKDDEQIATFIYSKFLQPDFDKYYNDCVDFLKKLIINSTKHDYNSPIFNGLLLIENKEMFMLWFVRLLPYMWV